MEEKLTSMEDEFRPYCGQYGLEALEKLRALGSRLVAKEMNQSFIIYARVVLVAVTVPSAAVPNRKGTVAPWSWLPARNTYFHTGRLALLKAVANSPLPQLMKASPNMAEERLYSVE